MDENNTRFEEFKKAIRDVSDSLDADVIIYSGPIEHPGDKKLVDSVRSFKSRPNVFFHLTTDGGFPDTAYRIARCLQRAYPNGKLTLFVDSHCKSAGTLIAIGADEIVMSVMAEFGPLDVQLSKPDALAEQTSGLTPTQAIHTLRNRALESLEQIFLSLRFKSGLQITTRTALEMAVKMTTGLFCPIFEQIDPMRLGEISRAMLIANTYGERLSRGNEKHGALQRLTQDYPSHGFVIDRDEMAELFNEVREPTEIEEKFAILVSPLVDKALDEDEPTVEFLSILTQDDQTIDPEHQGDTDENNDHSGQRKVPQTPGGDGSPVTEVGRKKKQTRGGRATEAQPKRPNE